MQTIDAILSAGNLTEASREIRKGAAGVDAMSVKEMKPYLVDIDLKGFFDEVDHCLLLQILYRKIKCRETMRLIRRWLRVPILLDGKLVKRRKGVPQGNPLSPLLSNIMLHELDMEMERRKLRFVRYADPRSLFWQKNLHPSKGMEVIKEWRRPTLPQQCAVPSALAVLTSLFGMGRGGTPPQ